MSFDAGRRARKDRGARERRSAPHIPRFLRVLGLASIVVAVAILRAESEPLAQDSGAAGAWQRLQKLQTTASMMHTTAHPDDEHGGMLAQSSRGRGARVSLLTLTRGESGDNAIGPELFDAVGLIRTEELLAADRYYGVDAQYFTTAVDYGFSKRLEEALVKWGRDNVLRDVVRIIRIDRPLVVVSRFQGNERDGHGNHQAAGLITQEAYRVAGDPAAFPEQIRDGLRPWQPLKLYIGGVRENEDWTLKIDTNEYGPWIGDTYQMFAARGLSFERSQNGGRVVTTPASAIGYYKRLASASHVRVNASAAKEATFFDGIDTTLPGLFTMLGRAEPPGARAGLGAIDAEVQAAVRTFSMQTPSASVPALARGLAATRRLIDALAAEPDAAFVLKIKEQQFADAINAALGVEFRAIAQVAGPAVPGQRVAVDVALTNRGSVPIEDVRLELVADPAWEATGVAAADQRLGANRGMRQVLTVVVAQDAAPTRPYFARDSIAESRYRVLDPAQQFRPFGDPPVTARARYIVDHVAVEARTVVRRREARLPYGEELRELTVAPAIAVNVSPRMAIAPVAAGRRSLDVRVELVNNADREVAGRIALRLPPAWTSSPAGADFRIARPGERSTYGFTVSAASIAQRDYRIDAVATVDGREYAQGYEVIEHRDLETRYLYHPAAIDLRGVDVAIAPNLTVGYVMGIGDEVPAAIAQLGASVTLLGEADLARGDLRRFDAIVTGTRAYAVRDDLRTNNRRLLDYVAGGGNLIVLYNTQELVPNLYAPHPAELTARAEEVSEEDSPVEILAPGHRVLNVPNRITNADFEGWVEQRGSKFFSAWDRAYTPIIATHDTGQPPQQGGWLTAEVGKGHYTYFAYALHRQLPYGVAGAYRILANLLSLSR
jgi:LmbE family N-acetylglucosaminyl deacetylase